MSASVVKKILGKGTSATVYLNENDECIKFYPSEYSINFEKEVEIFNEMKKFDENDFLAKLIETGQAEYNNQKGHFIKYEYIGKDIKTHIDSSNLTLDEFLKLYVEFIIHYLELFSKNSITHFDVKSSNVLFRKNKLVLIDYNLSFMNEQFTRKNLGQYHDNYYVWNPETNYFCTMDFGMQSTSSTFHCQIMNSYLDYINVVYQNRKNPFYAKIFSHIESECVLYLAKHMDDDNSLPINELGNLHLKQKYFDWWGIGILGCECINYIYQRDYDVDSDAEKYLENFENICNSFVLNFNNCSIEKIYMFIESNSNKDNCLKYLLWDTPRERVEFEFEACVDKFKKVCNYYISKNIEMKPVNKKFESIIYYKQTDIYKNYFYNEKVSKNYFCRLLYDQRFNFVFHSLENLEILFNKLRDIDLKFFYFFNYFSLLIS